MIVTKKYISDLREKSFMNISKNVENIILRKLGKVADPDDNGHTHENTSQDIWKQVRKIIKDN